MLRGSDGFCGACSCGTFGKMRSEVQSAYADQLGHINRLPALLLQTSIDSASLCDMSNTDRLADYEQFVKDISAFKPTEELTDTDAKGDATELYCEQCGDDDNGFLVGDSPLPALEVAARHLVDNPDHDVLFLEPVL